jgi:nitrogen fixation/metabolism regulation signal transduction histidine kinase
VPATLAKNAEAVQAVYRDYQELSLGRQGLQRIYTATLTLTLTLSVLTAVALAFISSRRLSAPLSILAEGTQAVAAGDFSPRQSLPARDELGVLTQSFNRMTRQLQEARALAEQNRTETEAARAYLESVLNNLSSGVLAFDEAGHLRAANQGARAILHDELAGFEALPLADWPRFAELREALESAFASASPEWQSQLDMLGPQGATQTLLLRGSRLPAGGGRVVVFDDITQLIAAQRNAAWAEVAQRLAHEIKNPLTPIQLSAERLQQKLADKHEPSDAGMLKRATATIVNQVEALKVMVNDFRDYARLPTPQRAALNLNALVREVLELYASSRAKIEVHLAADLPPVQGDAKQLRQVIHNLIRNAEDATAESEAPEIVLTTTHAGNVAELELRDNGNGFPPAILARAFEPYVTTKSRGTGLGLPIVKKIIDEHSGEIALANTTPRGATVRLRLPLASTHLATETRES